jgi:organic hydroperoxide reductase OsmC/OhrA
MQEFPHHYTVSANGTAHGDVELSAARVSSLRSASPAEFDGPGDLWSPETLLVAAVGDCFVLTFRAVARASKLEWTSLRCQVAGTLDRVDRTTQFVKFEIYARLRVPFGTQPEMAQRVLDKAERSCLISNSLKSEIRLVATIDIVAAPVGELTLA